MKALVGAFNQEKALVGAFSVIVKTGCGTDGALHGTSLCCSQQAASCFTFHLQLSQKLRCQLAERCTTTAPRIYSGLCCSALKRAVTEGFYAELLLPLESKYVEQTRHKLVAHNNMVELNSNFNIHIYTCSTSCIFGGLKLFISCQ